MTEHIDDWYKLAAYNTNIQGELHANLLKNNGIAVSVQVLSSIPGMNSGAVLWVKQEDVAKAVAILDSLAVNVDSIADDSLDTDSLNANNLNANNPNIDDQSKVAFNMPDSKNDDDHVD